MKSENGKAQFVLEQRQAKVRQLVAAKRFGEAVGELEAILAELNKAQGQGKPPEERASVAKWLEEVKKQRDAAWLQRYQSGKASFEKHNYKKALAKWSRLPKDFQDLAKLRPEAQQRLKAWYRAIDAGKKLWKQRDLRGAIEQWEKALQIRPNNAALQKKIAEAKGRTGDRSLLDDYLAEAQRHLEQQSFDAAQGLCLRALELKPGNPKAVALLKAVQKGQFGHDLAAIMSEGDRQFAGGKYGDAIAAWQRAVRLASADPATKTKLADKIRQAQSKQLQFRLIVAGIALGVALGLAFVVVFCFVK